MPLQLAQLFAAQKSRNPCTIFLQFMKKSKVTSPDVPYLISVPLPVGMGVVDDVKSAMAEAGLTVGRGAGLEVGWRAEARDVAAGKDSTTISSSIIGADVCNTAAIRNQLSSIHCHSTELDVLL